MMKITAIVIFLAGLCPFVSGQENAAATHSSAPAIGIEVGRPAPAFSGVDQFGHENSNESLKGAKGTVLLFFRSADW
ncbi:MAG TPA: hypothetical protein VKP58_06355 [Candidatus Acidoferrum sp.]|nr:hypothetical protein [Candidatus Acidoferrum sp.]